MRRWPFLAVCWVAEVMDALVMDALVMAAVALQSAMVVIEDSVSAF